MKTNPTDFVPAMRENEECPYCKGPTVNVGFAYITCGAAWNPDCFGHRVRSPLTSEAIMTRFDAAIDAIKRA